MGKGSVRMTAIDLLVGILVAIILLAYLLPGINSVRDYAWLEVCASHLREVGVGLANYARDNGARLPRTRFDSKAGSWNQFTNPHASNPFGSDGPLPNDVTAAMHLLIRYRYTGPEVFRCPLTEPGSRALPSDAVAHGLSNFESADYLGYSIANPYPNSATETQGYHWDSSLPEDFAVAADLNPGAGVLAVGTMSMQSELEKANSRNHMNRSGENVLFADWHVEYVTNPFCGVARDNIYTWGQSTATNGGQGVVGSSASRVDSVLLPMASSDPRALEEPWLVDARNERRSKVIWVTACIGVFVAVVMRIMKHYRARTRSNS